jgi:hypothetical protein
MASRPQAQLRSIRPRRIQSRATLTYVDNRLQRILVMADSQLGASTGILQRAAADEDGAQALPGFISYDNGHLERKNARIDSLF